MKLPVYLPAQPFYRVGEAEGVYAERASRGLLLKKLGRCFDRYERSEPRTLRYRLEFFKEGKQPDDEQLELYAGAGWSLVSSCAYNGRAIFVTADPAAPDPYDPASELAMLRRLRRDRFMNGIWFSLYCLLLGFQLSGFGKIGFYGMLAASNSIVVLAGLLLALLICQGGYGTVRLSRMISRLKRGQPLDHEGRISPVERVQRALCLTLTAAAILSGVSLFFEAYLNSQEHPLPPSSAGTPWFEAADLSPDLHRMTAEESEHHYIKGAECTIQSGGTFFYPIVYDIESYAVRGEVQAGQTVDSVLLNMEYYEARTPELAQKLAWDIAERSIWLHKDEEPRPVTNRVFDLLLYAGYEKVVVRGTRVYAVTCIEDNGTLMEIYALIDQKLTEQEGKT